MISATVQGVRQAERDRLTEYLNRRRLRDGLTLDRLSMQWISTDSKEVFQLLIVAETKTYADDYVTAAMGFLDGIRTTGKDQQ